MDPYTSARLEVLLPVCKRRFLEFAELSLSKSLPLKLSEKGLEDLAEALLLEDHEKVEAICKRIPEKVLLYLKPALDEEVFRDLLSVMAGRPGRTCLGKQLEAFLVKGIAPKESLVKFLGEVLTKVRELRGKAHAWILMRQGQRGNLLIPSWRGRVETRGFTQGEISDTYLRRLLERLPRPPFPFVDRDSDEGGKGIPLYSVQDFLKKRLGNENRR